MFGYQRQNLGLEKNNEEHCEKIRCNFAWLKKLKIKIKNGKKMVNRRKIYLKVDLAFNYFAI